jgi:hypothetical protein
MIPYGVPGDARSHDVLRHIPESRLLLFQYFYYKRNIKYCKWSGGANARAVILTFTTRAGAVWLLAQTSQHFQPSGTTAAGEFRSGATIGTTIRWNFQRVE